MFKVVKDKITLFLLFLLPIFFALPDIGVRLFVINLRIDDIILYIIFFLNITELYKYKKIYKPYLFYFIHFILIVIAITSFIFVVFLSELDASIYYIAKFFGSLPFFIILPIVLYEKENRIFFFRGCVVGIIVFIFGLIGNYNSIMIDELESRKASAQFKSQMSFESLNANAVGLFGLIFGLILLQYYLYKKKLFVLILGILSLLIPFITFARGHSLAVIITLVVFIMLLRYSIKIKIIGIGTVVAIILTLFVLSNSNIPLVSSALNIDLKTGKGLSRRNILWAQGLELTKMKPFLGHGFTTETSAYKRYFEGHVSHNVYLHYSIELGIFVLMLFLFSLFYLLYNRYKLYIITNNKLYLLQFAFLCGFMVSDFAGNLMYFNKYAFIIYTMLSMYSISDVEFLKNYRKNSTLKKLKDTE